MLNADGITTPCYFIRTKTNIYKFCSLKNPFPMIASLSELYLRIRRFILLVKTKKVISMSYGSSTSR